MNNLTSTFLLGTALLLAASITAPAVTITNPSFESPNTEFAGPDGYVFTTDGGYNETHLSGIQFSGTGTLNAADGSQFLQLSGAGSSVYQDLGALDPNSTYTLTIAVGRENYSGLPPESLISLLNGTDLSGTTLASYDTNSFTFNSDVNGATPFSDVSFNFTTGATVSGDITFAIQNLTDPEAGGYDRAAFDNVRLTEIGGSGSIPEPSTWAMVFSGLGLLIGVQLLRGRRNSQF